MKIILKIAFISLFLIAFASCDNNMQTKGRTIVISVASDYSDTNANKLNNPPNDQAALIGQIQTLSNGDVEIYTFRVENNSRYYFPPEVASDAFIYGKLEKEEAIENKTSLGYKKRIQIKNKQENKKDWTLFDVMKLIQSLDAGKDDLIIFHYSGHGDTDGSLVTIVEDNKLIDRIGTNTIINTLCSYNPDAIKVMFIDACYSGNYIKDGILSSADRLEVEDRKEIYTGTSISDSLKGSLSIAFGKDSFGTPNLYVLAAASSGQQSYDFLDNGEMNQEWYGAFSFYLLRALGFDTSGSKPAKKDGEITLYSLYEDIWQSFPSSKKGEQTPRVTLSPLDVVLF